MRLFIAVKLNPTICHALEKVQRSMINQGCRGSFTRLENLHLPLAFIGEYPEPDDVLDVMQSVPFEPFDIMLSGFGSFGDLWWTGMRQNGALQSYVKKLRHALSDANIPFDRKKFSPHITLVRRASFVIRPEIVIPDTKMTADHISLFRSDRGKNGMLYTELGIISAGGII